MQESQSEKAERVVNLVQGGIMTVEEAPGRDRVMSDSADDWRYVVVDGTFWMFGYGYNERTQKAKIFFWITIRCEATELEPW